jgi:triacylglycerol esterase/lipase EstA (alpha/beta hydrolase family)
MTAFLLLLAFVAGVAAYASWASHWIAQGVSAWWFIAGAPLAYFAPALVLVTLWFVITWIWRTPRPPEARLGFASIMKLYWTEIWTVGMSWMLMVLHRWLIRDPPPAPAQRPIVLIHGVLVNDGVWLFVRRFLRRRGIAPVYTINYGPPLADIESFSEQLHAKIEQVRAATGAERVVLLAHSMGGLVARAYMRRHGGGRVAKLITIGTPHHGSILAFTFPGYSLGQMHPGNSWLAELNRDEARATPVPIVSIWSRHDNMVAPQASAELLGAENIAVAGIAHNALLGDAGVMEIAAIEIVRAKDASNLPEPGERRQGLLH